MYSNQDPFWHEEWADEEAQLRADLAVEQARATKAQRELEALQANNPEALTARLAAELGQPVEAVKAQLQAAKQSTAPPAPSSPKAPDQRRARRRHQRRRAQGADTPSSMRP